MSDPSPATQLFADLIEVAKLAQVEYEAVLQRGGTEKEAFTAALSVNKTRKTVWTRYANRLVK